jgi:L-glyceraldehyde 3-phosphate reductase
VSAALEVGSGLVIFSPLAQGLLTDRYLKGIPEDSRAGGQSVFLGARDVTEEKINKVRLLSYLADGRGQSMASLALAFVLRHEAVASVIVGASRAEQVADSVKVVENMSLSPEELAQIETILR